MTSLQSGHAGKAEDEGHSLDTPALDPPSLNPHPPTPSPPMSCLSVCASVRVCVCVCVFVCFLCVSSCVFRFVCLLAHSRHCSLLSYSFHSSLLVILLLAALPASPRVRQQSPHLSDFIVIPSSFKFRLSTHSRCPIFSLFKA